MIEYINGKPFIDMWAPDAEAQWAEWEKKNKRTGEVCACGHSVRYHSATTPGGQVFCVPGRTLCECREARTVVKTSNLRIFMQSTQGSARMHALGKALASAGLNESVVWEWIDPKCDDCKTETTELTPMAVNASGRVSDVTTQWNIVVCRDCAVKRY